jgi:hypothetical protein
VLETLEELDFELELLVESFELLELPDVLVDELVGFVEELLVVFVEDEEEVVTGFEVDPVYPRL